MRNQENFKEPLPENRSCDENTDARILDGIVLNPAEVPAFPRIFRFEQQPGQMRILPDEPLCNEAGIPPIKVERSINEYKLNCDRLAEARLRVYRPIEQAIKRLRETNTTSLEPFKSLARIHLGPTEDGQWGKFFTLIRWRLGKVAEDYLKSISYAG